jgi:hypothetical protein
MVMARAFSPGREGVLTTDSAGIAGVARLSRRARNSFLPLDAFIPFRTICGVSITSRDMAMEQW